MATQTPTNTKTAASVIREEDLQDLEEFQRDVQAKIDTAQGDGRIYMMSQYVRILAMIKSEVKKIRDRFDRESMAENRKSAKALKEALKEEKEKEEATKAKAGDAA